MQSKALQSLCSPMSPITCTVQPRKRSLNMPQLCVPSLQSQNVIFPCPTSPLKDAPPSSLAPSPKLPPSVTLAWSSTVLSVVNLVDKIHAGKHDNRAVEYRKDGEGFENLTFEILHSTCLVKCVFFMVQNEKGNGDPAKYFDCWTKKKEKGLSFQESRSRILGKRKHVTMIDTKQISIFQY